MTYSEILIAARAKIADEKGWCQGRYALNAHGQPCAYDNPDAVSFCTAGAVLSVANTRQGEDALNFCYEASAEQLLLEGGGRSVVRVNDILGHAATVKMFDRAIALAQAKETSSLNAESL